MTTDTLPLGIMFRRENPPELLPEFARRAESLGFEELWVVEDCFYTSGIASAAVALACTSSIRVGLGIMPAVARNPAFTAMEIATLVGLYPQRFLPGIGHGVGEWMKQIGAFPPSQLVALGETSDVVRRLLRGENVTFHGQHVHLDHVKLEFPPAHVPPVSLGVRGPKSLALSGRVADGTILAELSSPAYVRWAREQINASEPHRITVYALSEVDADPQLALQRLRPVVADWLSYGQGDYTRPLGIEAEVNAMRENGGAERIAAEMPDSWIEQMTVVGTPHMCVQSVRRLLDAGASSVVYVPQNPGIESLDTAHRILTA